ncbi:acyl-CoA thioesterase [Hippea maritima]|uniref:Thioesterase superfamily protein n=1 Tax=Hippea maritima (strain ATCC 700847 / DSM 10411 / MH2) TaxID=760142 RepID=F2LWM2_HIPMA|nr:thioesterase family protein [Hippea maritima]AEA34131.1 thioesterase superfamily protein [Hippea maritima DSM 10411]
MAELAYKTKIYYDDTDAGGVVYYANYLKLYERAKQEFFLMKGCNLFRLHYDGIYLIVKEVRANYIKSLRLGEEALVFVDVKKIKKASIELYFQIKVKDELRAEAEILSVAVDTNSRIVKLPDCVSKLLT